jgi:hypothetical protein
MRNTQSYIGRNMRTPANACGAFLPYSHPQRKPQSGRDGGEVGFLALVGAALAVSTL